MAEALLEKYGSGEFEAESAGLEPGQLNPNAIRVMKEIGIDISGKQSKEVFDLFKAGRLYSAVISVCDEATSERCPIFPGVAKRIAWSFPDPSGFAGSSEQILERTRQVRNDIETKIKEFVREARDMSFWTA
jgi:arsenate reductase